MQFKHPEFLYALLALLIPIFIHLFQLRKFKNEAFTNVSFLKNVSIQTRKSSQLKKWLTLLTRLLIFAAIIFAFAQPYFANESAIETNTKTAIYLDNSFSLQAKGANGSLFKRAVQEILSNLNDDETVSLFTNTKTFVDVNKKDIQNDLLDLEYSSHQISYNAAYLKAKQFVSSSDPKTTKRVILVSDFQQKESNFKLPVDASTKTHLIQLTPVTKQNISIDSLYTNRNKENELVLNAIISNTDVKNKDISVALYDDDKLISKTSITTKQNSKSKTEFTLQNDLKINGRVSIEDPSITFDNSRFFTINNTNKVKVVAVNKADDSFLKNIYTKDEFDLKSSSPENLNYNDISNANLVVLNELNQIPLSLLNSLKPFVNQGGIICFIPGNKGDLESYNQLIKTFSEEGLQLKNNTEKKISRINFENHLYDGVFDKDVSNFEYPKVNSFYKADAIDIPLYYEDNAPFLYKTNSLYVFTAAISKENSNFKNSPLIVPTFYKIGKESLQLSDISYTIGALNTFDIPIEVGQDGIVSLVLNQNNIIPLQQSFTNKVKITTDETPTLAGNYSVQHKNKNLQNVSYNYNSSESNLQYYDLNTTEQYQVSNSVTELFDQIKEESSINELWKWFIIFALIFILIEILLLKYLK